MDKLIKEIREIPDAAALCYELNKNIKLPKNVPYLAMGGSYHAALTLFYCGAEIQPVIASEYFRYLSKVKAPKGALISQSGETSEVLWNLARFKKVIAITNNLASSLATAPNVQELIPIHAGKEEYLSSTKTYINTLITLYLGLGIDPRTGVAFLKNNFRAIERESGRQAEKIFSYFTKQKPKSFFVIGSGPNSATAMHAALVLTETLKLPWIGTSAGQFDHGLKEAAGEAIIIMLDGGGKDSKRMDLLQKTLRDKTNSLVIRIRETRLPENLTPLALIAHMDFLMNYLADYMKIDSSSLIGEKITRVPKEAR